MKKPVLAILAAGIGSRYGGLKQIDPVGEFGELIIDYSIYDALHAGFESIVFIIKKDIESDFRDIIGRRMEKNADVSYAFQEQDILPPGYENPSGRSKPWGTTHALLCARSQLDRPFAVINADDYYGRTAFSTIHEWLSQPQKQTPPLHYAMVGYRIENTVSEHGFVTRGVCSADDRGFLRSVDERKMIEKTASGARYSLDKGETWTDIPAGTLVSMNFWGLPVGFLDVAEEYFPKFLDENLPQDPQKCEYLLPIEIDRQLRDGIADVRVLESKEVWYGITYREDKVGVSLAVARMNAQGLYPSPLWRSERGA